MEERVWYILVDREVTPVYDLFEWASFYEHFDRIVCKTRLKGDILVSTVFLGLDHRYGGDGPPILFETMIFGGKHNEYQERYCTWTEAESGHVLAVGLADGDRWNWFMAQWMRLVFKYRNWKLRQFLKPKNLKKHITKMKKLLAKLREI